MKKISIILITTVFLFGSIKPVFAEETATLSLQQEYQKALVQLIGLLQAQVVDLMKQLQELQSNQTIIQTSLQTSQDTQRSLETKIDTIITNTTPVYGATVEKKPVISQFINLNGDEGTTTSISLVGDSCQPFIGKVSVKYSDGSLVNELYKYITEDGKDHGTNLGNFVYRSQLNSGVDIVIIKIGDILKEIKFNIIPKIDTSICY